MIQDTLTYTLDTLSSSAYALAVSVPSTGIDCREASSVSGFTITAKQPEGTDIRLAFADGDSWFTLNSSGGGVTLSGSVPSYSLLLEKGNTVAQLRALSNIPAFAGKLIRVAAALSSTDPRNLKPSVKIGVNANASRTETVLTEYSPVYDLNGGSAVNSLAFSKIVTGGASVKVEGRLTHEDGSESDWLDSETIRGAYGTALQLRCVYAVPAAGSGSAKMTLAEAVCSSNGASAVSGTGRIYFLTTDWADKVRTCRVTVRHSRLEDSSMKLYAAFRASPSLAVRENLGVSSGARQTFTLQHKNGIKADSFRLFADGQEIFGGFELNGGAGRVTLTAAYGSIISCTYQYGWDLESWQAMTLEGRFSYPDYDESRYTLTADGTFSAGSFMIETSGTSGKIAGQKLGYATGKAQTVRLNKRCSGGLWVESGGEWDSSIGHYKNAYRVDPKNYTLLDGQRLIRFACPAGELVRAAYDWESEPVSIFFASAVFSY